MQILVKQIYFKEHQKKFLMEGFIPFYNGKGNERQLFETEVFLNFFNESSSLCDTDFYGALSWRFAEKTGIKTDEFFDFVRKRVENDVLLFNPYPELVYLYDNPWIQGENVHPGLLEISQKVFNRSKFQIKLDQLRLEQNRQVYCNYFVGTGRFWKNYISYVKELVFIIESDPSIRKLIFKKTSYNYEASFLPFFLERLLPTYLFLNPTIKSESYEYNDPFLVKRYLNVIKEKETALFRHQKFFRKIPFYNFFKKLVKY